MQNNFYILEEIYMSRLHLTDTVIGDDAEYEDISTKLKDIVAEHNAELVDCDSCIDDDYLTTIDYFMDKHKKLYLEDTLTKFLTKVCDEIKKYVNNNLTSTEDDFDYILVADELLYGFVITFGSSLSF